MKFKPTRQQQELIADMTNGGMASKRIASALGILPEVYTLWVSRLAAARALDPQAVEYLLYPPPPVIIQPVPPQRDPRIVAERIFEAAE
jgi:transposase-like protein